VTSSQAAQIAWLFSVAIYWKLHPNWCKVCTPVTQLLLGFGCWLLGWELLPLPLNVALACYSATTWQPHVELATYIQTIDTVQPPWAKTEQIPVQNNVNIVKIRKESNNTALLLIKHMLIYHMSVYQRKKISNKKINRPKLHLWHFSWCLLFSVFFLCKKRHFTVTKFLQHANSHKPIRQLTQFPLCLCAHVKCAHTQIISVPLHLHCILMQCDLGEVRVS